ncbi:MAG: hypothetical protein JW829_02820 [Pirellulales bacterium]|nr:hypothetical protein [Pirellulales bacterium]
MRSFWVVIVLIIGNAGADRSAASALGSPSPIHPDTIAPESAHQAPDSSKNTPAGKNGNSTADRTQGPGYDDETPADPDGETAKAPKAPSQRMGPPNQARRISPDDAVWIHRERGAVIVDGRISLREGMLEMFACPRGTKEHESIVSVDSKAFVIHAALLNVGAEPGHPARFHPKYQPATGTVIQIQVLWMDEQGKRHNARAQEWVRDLKSGKALAHPWVFAGSGFWHNPETNRKHYQAESGDLICVSNFSSAMLDLPIESSQGNDELAFEAFTERIPPLGTHVRLILTPQQEKPKVPAKADNSVPKNGPSENTKANREFSFQLSPLPVQNGQLRWVP